MSTPDPATLEGAAWIRKHLLDTADGWLVKFVLAMRAEGIGDDVAARVLDRMTLGVPDPDQVTAETHTPYGPDESVAQQLLRERDGGSR